MYFACIGAIHQEGRPGVREAALSYACGQRRGGLEGIVLQRADRADMVKCVFCGSIRDVMRMGCNFLPLKRGV